MAISIPNTFVPSTKILSAQVNANFTALSTGAVNKAGDTMTGTLVVPTLTVSGAATIGTTLGVTGAVTISATGAAALDVAGGINAGSGNVSIVGTDGRIPALTSTYLASLDGTALTGISGAESDQTILSGQVYG